jgi:hypothetical protein
MSEAYIESVRQLHPAAYAAWTEEEEQRLMDLVREGRSVDDIAVELGRQPGGIRSRIKRLEDTNPQRKEIDMAKMEDITIHLRVKTDLPYEVSFAADSLERLIEQVEEELPKMRQKLEQNRLEEAVSPHGTV